MAICVLTTLSSAREEEPRREILCKRITLQGELEPGLSETEKKLLCGDPEREAWETIPFTQVRFNMKNFLQERGYFHPTFIRDSKQEEQGEGHFLIEVGPLTRVSSIQAEGAPESLSLRRKRKVVGAVLTPALLEELEQWVTQRLQSVGYPCPKVITEADPETGVIVVHVTTGPLQDLVSIIEEPVPGVQPGVLRRYDAFRLGQPFNGDLLTVTSNRITSLNLLQSTHFTIHCEKGGAVAHQWVTAGPPRLLIFGVGVDTEGLFELKASWRNARVGNRASWIDISAHSSTKEQRVEALANWYALERITRTYLQPLYNVRHQNENAFEVIATRARFSAATTWDNQTLGAQAFLGPALDFVRTLQGSGQGNPNSGFLSLEGSLRVRSHNFELWATDPRTGANALLTVDFAPGIFSTVPVQRLNLSGELLWNYRDYEPPLWIFGIRGGLQATISGERPGFSSRLPANFFSYLGGSQNLRGFSRQSVPKLGAMTAAFVNPEFRLTDVLPFNIQPFLFVDFGWVGVEPFSFDSPLLYSPGIGVRYLSPIGVFRTTIARGFPIDTPGGWNFYLSFGEEF